MNHHGPVDLTSIGLTGCSLIQNAILDVQVPQSAWHHALAFFAAVSLISASVYNTARFLEWCVSFFKKHFKK